MQSAGAGAHRLQGGERLGRCGPGLGRCGTQASVLRGPRDLLRPGIKPVSPEWEGGLFTTEPLVKPSIF